MSKEEKVPEEKAQAAAAAAAGSGTRLPASAPAGKGNFTRRFPRFILDVRLQVKMFQAGELQQLLAEKGVTVSAAASA